jgi:hypothetical protein
MYKKENHMKKRIFVACASLVIFLVTMTYGQSLPRTFVLDPSVLSRIKKEINGGSKEYSSVLKTIKKNAEKALKTVPVSVMEKSQTPPSGDKHDYMSMGKYWWPDSSKQNGLPYMRRDGEVNPEIKDCSDIGNSSIMIRAVSALSLAYYFVGDEEYAEHAAKFLRTWFLDPATRMNPNMNFAQAVPGRNDGRGAGIIDAHQIIEIVDALGLLEPSSRWTMQDRKGISEWFRQYYRWLRESKNGKDEVKAKNNHGSWYDVQCVSVCMFLGEENDARTIVTESREKRIAAQIEPDGSQPFELVRTKSFDYSMFNVKALVTLAVFGERLGIDLWQYETKDGRGIKKAIDNLLPYVAGEKKWESKQIIDAKTGEMYPVLLKAARVYRDKKYSEIASSIPGIKGQSIQSLLITGK